ncbi:hypothetical protein CLCR_00746 [Cladophialophora carrionii]|uniref:Uncharacterized protein n=1 Tax=Cladophialophora carrionii TaxID=86049 RepID=A0A1C1C6N4_9EURO|nr:hypothetical protein CLCR_00746 [Cladophialophora carrionii]
MPSERVQEAAMRLCDHGCLAVDREAPRRLLAGRAGKREAVCRESEDESVRLSSIGVECDSRDVLDAQVVDAVRSQVEVEPGRVQLRK